MREKIKNIFHPVRLYAQSNFLPVVKRIHEINQVHAHYLQVLLIRINILISKLTRSLLYSCLHVKLQFLI